LRIVKLRLLFAAILLAPASFAAPPAPQPVTHRGGEPERYPAWRAAAVASLIERGDAYSFATAAALMFAATAPSMQAEGLVLAGRASAIDPQNAAIGWLRLRLCVLAAGCDVRASATDMRWLDAENAAAWLPTLTAAYRDRDATEVDRVLMDMAQTRRFDLYWNRIIVLLFESLRGAEKVLPGGLRTTDASRLALVEGIAATEIVPRFAALIDACRDPGAGTERRETCLKVSKLMQQSDATPVQLAGLAMERHMLPVDGREARALAERRHVIEWRTATSAQFDAPLLPWLKNAHARWRLARMKSLRREEDVAIAILREQGMPLDPPKEAR
jgi:hypothetical protein